MAAAGARAGAAAGTNAWKSADRAGWAEYTVSSIKAREAAHSRRRIVVASAAGVFAVGAVTLAFVILLGDHDARTSAGSPRTPAPGALAGAGVRGSAASLQVAGTGCPRDGDTTVTLDDPAAVPAWEPAAGGWTGNGCDGATLWTHDPHGSQPGPSALTWSFRPVPGSSRCMLEVFVPTQHALGVSDYVVSDGPLTAHQVAAFLVSQAAEHGQWFSLGTYPVSRSPLEITAVPVPGLSRPGHAGEIAASAARARCT